MINANGRHLKIAVAIMLLALSIITASTLIIVFTRDLKTKKSDHSVSGHNGGSVDILEDQQGAPVTSGDTKFLYGLVSDNAVAVGARDLVDFNEDPRARIGSFDNRAHRNQFLSAIDTMNIDMGRDAANPVTLSYRVLGVITAKERVTFKLNGATGDLDLHLFKDGEDYASMVGQADYFGQGTMNDGTPCVCTGGEEMVGPDDNRRCPPDDQSEPVKPVSRSDPTVKCDHPYRSPQEARVCSADPDILCEERMGTPWGRQHPRYAWGRPGGRMLEEGKPQRRKLCATCVAVGAAVAGGTASSYSSQEITQEAGICRRNMWGQPTCNPNWG